MERIFKSSGIIDLSTLAITGQAPTLIINQNKAIQRLDITAGTNSVGSAIFVIEFFFDWPIPPTISSLADFIWASRGTASFRGRDFINIAPLKRSIDGKIYARNIGPVGAVDFFINIGG